MIVAFIIAPLSYRVMMLRTGLVAVGHGSARTQLVRCVATGPQPSSSRPPPSPKQSQAPRPPRLTPQAVKQAVSLVEVVRDHGIKVEQAGAVHKARCPFHGEGRERTPSLNIKDERYRCFACGATGDAITFVQEHESVGFVDALRLLAERYGIEGTVGPPPAPERARPPAEQAMVDAHAAAAEFYQGALRGPSGQAAAAFLRRERGVTSGAAYTFGLGYAPAGGFELSNFLSKRGYSAETLVASGLCLLSKNGKPYDRFRDRVMIPIHDASGTVVAFGGRLMPPPPPPPPGAPAMPPSAYGGGGGGGGGGGFGGDRDGKEAPKYLNSAESPIFRKSEMLYGLHLARPEARRRAQLLVVEGYMDVIALHAAGVTHAVASLGTMVSEGQLRLAAAQGSARAVPCEVVLSLDGDAAGTNAAARLVERGILAALHESGISVRVAAIADASPVPPAIAAARAAAAAAAAAAGGGGGGAADAATDASADAAPCKDPDEFLTACRTLAAAGRPQSVAASADAAAAAGRLYMERVVDTAPGWLEWAGRQAAAPYLRSADAGGGGGGGGGGAGGGLAFEGAVASMVSLLRTVAPGASRLWHQRQFARLLASGDAAFAERLDELLGTMLALPTGAAAAGAPPTPAVAPPSPPPLASSAAAASSAPASVPAPPPPPLTAASLPDDVAVSSLFVWRGLDGGSSGQQALHWRDCCAGQPARPPAASELGLPLCGICCKDELRAAASQLHAEHVAPPDTNAADASADGGNADASSPPPPPPSSSSSVAAEVAAAPRAMAEVSLLGALLAAPPLRARVTQPPPLSTPARRWLLAALTAPPRAEASAQLWAEWAEEWADAAEFGDEASVPHLRGWKGELEALKVAEGVAAGSGEGGEGGGEGEGESKSERGTLLTALVEESCAAIWRDEVRGDLQRRAGRLGAATSRLARSLAALSPAATPLPTATAANATAAQREAPPADAAEVQQLSEEVAALAAEMAAEAARLSQAHDLAWRPEDPPE